MSLPQTIRNLKVAEVTVLRNIGGFGVLTATYADTFPYIVGTMPGASTVDDAFLLTPPGDGRVWSLLKLDGGGGTGLTSLKVFDLRIDNTQMISGSFPASLPIGTLGSLIVGGQTSSALGLDYQNILQAATPIPIRDKLYMEFQATSPAGPGNTFQFGIFIVETYAPRLQQFPFRR